MEIGPAETAKPARIRAESRAATDGSCVFASLLDAKTLETVGPIPLDRTERL